VVLPLAAPVSPVALAVVPVAAAVLPLAAAVLVLHTPVVPLQPPDGVVPTEPTGPETVLAVYCEPVPTLKLS